MTKRQLLKKLRELQETGDAERQHATADDLLIEYIGDPLIKKEYDLIEKWYA
jgi:hypothetical protein